VGVDRLVDELSSQASPFVTEKAAEALLNLAFNANNLIKIANTEGCLLALVNLVKDGSPGAREMAAGALSNLAVHEENKIKIAKTEGCLLALVNLVKDGSPVARGNAAWALWNLSFNSNNLIKIGEEDALAPLLDLAKGGSKSAEVLSRKLKKTTRYEAQLISLIQSKPSNPAGYRLLGELKYSYMPSLRPFSNLGTKKTELRIGPNRYELTGRQLLSVSKNLENGETLVNSLVPGVRVAMER
jgi:HEAT repeat protein